MYVLMDNLQLEVVGVRVTRLPPRSRFAFDFEFQGAPCSCKDISGKFDASILVVGQEVTLLGSWAWGLPHIFEARTIQPH